MIIGMTTSNAQRVRNFHAALADDYPSTPTVPSPELLALRIRLIEEEHAEVSEAAQEIAEHLSTGSPLRPTELAPLAHELVDLLYVTPEGFRPAPLAAVIAKSVSSDSHGRAAGSV